MDDVEVITTTGKVPTTDICGNAYNLPQQQWRLISLPCNPGVTNTPTGQFGDDISGTYGTDWLMYEYDGVNNKYNSLSDSSALAQGNGYWLISLNKATLDVTGTATPLSFSANCPAPTNECFEIALQKPPGAGLEQYNMLGHPLPYPVNWADVRIVANGDPDSPFTPSGALAKGYFSKVMQKYTGSAYAAFDDVTPGYEEGALGAYDGIWVKVLDGSLGSGALSLIIPPIRAPGIITTALLDKAQSVSDAGLNQAGSEPYISVNKDHTLNWLNILNLLIEEVTAAPSNKWKQVPPGLAKRDAHRNSHRNAIKSEEEWYVRLIIDAPNEDLRDQGNVLGQLSDSELGYDEHDLKEIPPYSSPYLTLVFPHQDWGEYAGDYTSNYHPLGGKHDLDRWSFDVRSDDPTREISLSWSGNAKVLGKSRLIDNETGAVIFPAFVGKYDFVMQSNSRSFTWEYNYKSGKSGREKH